MYVFVGQSSNQYIPIMYLFHNNITLVYRARINGNEFIYTHLQYQFYNILNDLSWLKRRFLINLSVFWNPHPRQDKIQIFPYFTKKNNHVTCINICRLLNYQYYLAEIIIVVFVFCGVKFENLFKCILFIVFAMVTLGRLQGLIAISILRGNFIQTIEFLFAYTVHRR